MEHLLVRKIGMPCRRGTPLPMYTLIEGQTLQFSVDTGRRRTTGSVDRKSEGGARPEVICILASHCFRVNSIHFLRENNVTLICKLLPVLPHPTSGQAATSGHVGRA